MVQLAVCTRADAKLTLVAPPHTIWAPHQCWSARPDPIGAGNAPPHQRLEWPSSDEDVRMCQVKGKSREQCQNYIRVLKMHSPDTLFVCGTNAYKPRCRTYVLTVSIST